MESAAVFPAVPRRTGRRILTGLEKIMMLLGILVTTGLTLTATVTTGWVLATWWKVAESLPVVDGGGHNGRSAETALVIEAATEAESISAEYDWLALHRPLNVVTGERMESEGSLVYHVLEVNTWNGRADEIWFDITQVLAAPARTARWDRLTLSGGVVTRGPLGSTSSNLRPDFLVNVAPGVWAVQAPSQPTGNK